MHESAGDAEAAKQPYRDGIEAATQKGDAHAQGEIEAALDMIELSRATVRPADAGRRRSSNT